MLPEDIKSKNGVNHDDSIESELLPLAEIERRHILRAMKKTDWQISGSNGAARILDMNPSTLRSRIKKHNLKKS